MQDNFETQLKQNIKSLPTIRHSNDLWAKVQSQLDFEDKLNSKVQELPKYSINPKLWDNIKRKPRHRVNLISLSYLTGIAASIILLISIIQYSSSKKEYSKKHSIEIYSATEQLMPKSYTDDVSILLRQFCNYSNINCNSPDFMRIKSELTNLEDEIQKLNQVILNLGESDELIQCLIRMENQKSKFIDELLKS